MDFYCEDCGDQINKGMEAFSDEGELLCTDCLFEARCHEEFGEPTND